MIFSKTQAQNKTYKEIMNKIMIFHFTHALFKITNQPTCVKD